MTIIQNALDALNSLPPPVHIQEQLEHVLYRPHYFPVNQTAVSKHRRELQVLIQPGKNQPLASSILDPSALTCHYQNNWLLHLMYGRIITLVRLFGSEQSNLTNHIPITLCNDKNTLAIMSHNKHNISDKLQMIKCKIYQTKAVATQFG